jgi:hypothetical protein|uniref:polyketide cyclase / dehydrase and lipid transport n=1 Tax=Candidatus Nanopelagicus sp. TaxID=2518620 RepID=UPI00404B7263
MKERAEIVDTGIPLFYKVQIEIEAPAKKIFDFLSNPNNHLLMDGSDMLRGKIKGPDRLFLGAKFGMKMRYGIPYIITNQVIEYQENKAIAWQHLLHNVWRYEIVEMTANKCLVIESWDGRKAKWKWWIDDSYKWVPKAMARTLVKLKGLISG